jgi:malate dehydrogenase
VPIQLGRKGMEKVVEIELTDEERKAFEESAAAVRELNEMIPATVA